MYYHKMPISIDTVLLEEGWHEEIFFFSNSINFQPFWKLIIMETKVDNNYQLYFVNFW